MLKKSLLIFLCLNLSPYQATLNYLHGGGIEELDEISSAFERQDELDDARQQFQQAKRPLDACFKAKKLDLDIKAKESIDRIITQLEEGREISYQSWREVFSLTIPFDCACIKFAYFAWEKMLQARATEGEIQNFFVVLKEKSCSICHKHNNPNTIGLTEPCKEEALKTYQKIYMTLPDDLSDDLKIKLITDWLSFSQGVRFFKEDQKKFKEAVIKVLNYAETLYQSNKILLTRPMQNNNGETCLLALLYKTVTTQYFYFGSADLLQSNELLKRVYILIGLTLDQIPEESKNTLQASIERFIFNNKLENDPIFSQLRLQWQEDSQQRREPTNLQNCAINAQLSQTIPTQSIEPQVSHLSSSRATEQLPSSNTEPGSTAPIITPFKIGFLCALSAAQALGSLWLNSNNTKITQQIHALFNQLADQHNTAWTELGLQALGFTDQEITTLHQIKNNTAPVNPCKKDDLKKANPEMTQTQLKRILQTYTHTKRVKLLTTYGALGTLGLAGIAYLACR